MASDTPNDPMAEARVRWQRSAEADKQTFCAARDSIERLLNEYVELVNGVLSDAELTVEPEKLTQGQIRKAKTKPKLTQSMQVVLKHESLFPWAANKIRERLYHPDVDLAGILRCLDFMLMVVNTLGGRLEAPARKGNRSTLGSRKGGKTTKDEGAVAKARANNLIRSVFSQVKKKNPNLKSARRLATLIARSWPTNSAIPRPAPESIRKRLVALKLVVVRPRSKKAKIMGQVGPG